MPDQCYWDDTMHVLHAIVLTQLSRITSSQCEVEQCEVEQVHKTSGGHSCTRHVKVIVKRSCNRYPVTLQQVSGIQLAIFICLEVCSSFNICDRHAVCHDCSNMRGLSGIAAEIGAFDCCLALTISSISSDKHSTQLLC